MAQRVYVNGTVTLLKCLQLFHANGRTRGSSSALTHSPSMDRSVVPEWLLLMEERHRSAGEWLSSRADPSTDHADKKDGASSRHCTEICWVTNRPGALEFDYLELMLEVLLRVAKKPAKHRLLTMSLTVHSLLHAEISELRTRSCHWIRSIWRWHLKAEVSRVLISAAKQSKFLGHETTGWRCLLSRTIICGK